MLIFCDRNCWWIDWLRYQYRTSLPEPVNFSANKTLASSLLVLTFRIEEADQAGVHPESNLELY